MQLPNSKHTIATTKTKLNLSNMDPLQNKNHHFEHIDSTSYANGDTFSLETI